MAKTNFAQILSKAFFYRSKNKNIKTLVPYFKLVHYSKGETVLKQGEKVKKLYLISQGFVDVFLKENENEIKVGHIVQGEIFGEMSFISNSPASARIVAVKSADIFEISKKDFKKVIESDADLKLSFYYSLLKTLTERLRLTSSNYAINDYLLKLIKSQNDELNILNKKLTEVSKLKDYYLGIAAHDIRNPITIMSVYLQLILNGKYGSLNETGTNILIKIKNEMDFLSNLLNELLDVSQIEAGTITINKTKVNFKNLLIDSFNFNKILAQNKNIQFILQDDLMENVEIFLDKIKIQAVLNNLFSNAIKYSNNDKKVITKIFKKDNYIFIDIADEGIGIKAEDKDKIFKPFFKSKNKPTAGEKSTGLGLSITKKVIESHGGEIWFSSVIEKGTTFSFKLPIK